MKKASLLIVLYMTIVLCATAQNASYNVNTVPVSGSNNSAFGVNALNNTTSGGGNTAIGVGALLSNTTGFNNTSIGYSSLNANTTGRRNVANGNQALMNNSTGSHNSANGMLALLSNNTGNNNTAHGHAALYSNLDGSNNIAIGYSAGYASLGSGNVFIGYRGGYTETGSNKLYMANDVANTLVYGDFASGQLLLGNKNPTGYVFKGTRTLNVLGGVLADSVRVALSGNWADYVFADDYQLKPLGELETFIKTNKHLPNIPTAKEVAINGIELGDMNAKLLAKVEELTLYILQQQKQFDDQQKKMDAQQQQIDEIKKLLLKSK